jgi:hypothetical protein
MYSFPYTVLYILSSSYASMLSKGLRCALIVIFTQVLGRQLEATQCPEKGPVMRVPGGPYMPQVRSR